MMGYNPYCGMMEMGYNPYDVMRGMSAMNAPLPGGMMEMITGKMMGMSTGNNSGIISMLQKVMPEMEEMKTVKKIIAPS